MKFLMSVLQNPDALYEQDCMQCITWVDNTEKICYKQPN